MQVMTYGNRAHLKKRTNTRLMHKLFIRGLYKLGDGIKSIDDNEIADDLVIKFYEQGLKFCLN